MALIASLLAIPVAAPAATEIVVDPTDVDCDNDTGPVYCVGQFGLAPCERQLRIGLTTTLLL